MTTDHTLYNMVELSRRIAQTQGKIWDSRLEQILRFCLNNPLLFPKKGSIKIQFTTDTNENDAVKYLTAYINDYYIARDRAHRILTSSTIPDPAVSVLLQAHDPTISIPQLQSMETAHRMSMAAENLIGELLERYIAQTLEQHNWVWCCGSTVRAVDFIRITSTENIALQTKNRSNSENSSSSAIRKDTTIKKWHRIDAKSGKTYWGAFPENTKLPADQQLSEQGFYAFIRQTIQPQAN